ncbi:MAG: DUF1844 domain-containing protein [Candidatus Caldatribacterium sp.]|uniref:DUF1844 domain-containing protein n=1 Tax=Candidatus Caldatribacterium sp. TaxID=2282143 RepID=UPI002992CDCC|nr:DUF1844 domain-containing protein [Candidatus Caldatribacterium sp.]MCX7730835.1 DUF1844 domain-containing protein [Candidatus Caldatribacterium sp.]MDW8080739.1 DUF1844 domain-containing protein [Candidatus Calescibacterium sp.]
MEEKRPGKIKDLGYYFLNLLSAKAWQYLGLMVHPENGQILVDLEEARKAIDLFSVILDTLKKDLDKDELRELEFHLSNLQLNFVEKMRQLAQE